MNALIPSPWKLDIPCWLLEIHLTRAPNLSGFNEQTPDFEAVQLAIFSSFYPHNSRADSRK